MLVNLPSVIPLYSNSYDNALRRHTPVCSLQITIRALLVGLGLGVLFALVTLKLILQAGVVPGYALAIAIAYNAPFADSGSKRSPKPLTLIN